MQEPRASVTDDGMGIGRWFRVHLRSIEIYPRHRDFKPIILPARSVTATTTKRSTSPRLTFTHAAQWKPDCEADHGAEWKPFISEETDQRRIFYGGCAHVTRLEGFWLFIWPPSLTASVQVRNLLMCRACK